MKQRKDGERVLFRGGSATVYLAPSDGGLQMVAFDDAENAHWRMMTAELVPWQELANSPDLSKDTVANLEKKMAVPVADMIEALRAAQQCISDFLGVYRNGASMMIMDLAVNSLKNDALKKVDRVLQRFDEGGSNEIR